MKRVSELRIRSLRRERNTELVQRMRQGEQLSSFNSFASWYPPRPIIQKDCGAIEQLYGEGVTALHQLPKVDGMGTQALKPVRLA